MRQPMTDVRRKATAPLKSRFFDLLIGILAARNTDIPATTRKNFAISQTAGDHCLAE
jgi:hypothetical protein